MATAGDGAILTLHRDVAHRGARTQRAARRLHLDDRAAGCQALAQLGATTSLAIAASGDALYAASAGGLIAFAGRRLRPASRASCAQA